MIARLREILRGRGDGRMIVVTIYSRPGCGCCRTAKGVIEGLRKRYSLQVEEFDVDQSDELRKQYGDQVPVVTIDGKARFRGKVDPVLLERLLRAESVARKGDPA